jgi:hypothetical protein
MHSEYVIITAFPWQQWLREHTTMLRYTYSAFSVPCYFRLLCTSTVRSVYRVPSVIMCSTANLCGNCSVVWDAVSLQDTCTEGWGLSISTGAPPGTAKLCTWESILWKHKLLSEKAGKVWLKTVKLKMTGRKKNPYWRAVLQNPP